MREVIFKVHEEDIGWMCHTIAPRSSNQYPERFDKICGDLEDETGWLMWCGREYISALCVYRVLTALGHRAGILADSCDDEYYGGQWVVWSDYQMDKQGKKN